MRTVGGVLNLFGLPLFLCRCAQQNKKVLLTEYLTLTFCGAAMLWRSDYFLADRLDSIETCEHLGFVYVSADQR